MKLERYEYSISGNLQQFEFCSDGPKGIIRKVVEFTLQNSNGKTYLNVGFGDWNHEKIRIDDLIVTNNSDKQKILATVAAIILFFTKQFPDMFVYAKGSTSARTRLYQMGIRANWEKIDPKLHIFGYTGNQWQLFRKNVNYEAFLVRWK